VLGLGRVDGAAEGIDRVEGKVEGKVGDMVSGGDVAFAGGGVEGGVRGRVCK
jgi:hypothetical protein